MNKKTRILALLALTLPLMLPAVSNAQTASHTETVNICATMRAKEGKTAELRNALLSLATPTRSEEGHIAYDVYEEKDGALFLHEVWRSQEDLDRHLQKPNVQDFVRKSAERLDGKNDAHFGKAISLSEKPQVTRSAESISICSIKHPKDGKADELRHALLSLTEPTSKEPGSIAYNIYEEKDGSFFLFETWRSLDDLERHFSTPYVRDFRSKVDALTDRNEIHIGKLISR